MPRLFTGLEIPSDLADELEGLGGGLAGGRSIDAENLHVTLRFLGDVDDRTGEDVARALGAVRRAPFEVTLDGLDAFGGDRPRSIVARARPSPALAELQAEHERIARRAGLPPETRKFTPHVTLARLRGVSSAGVAHHLQLRGLFPARRFTVARFVLFSSRDAVGGGPYVVEAAYPLRAQVARPVVHYATAEAWLNS